MGRCQPRTGDSARSQSPVLTQWKRLGFSLQARWDPRTQGCRGPVLWGSSGASIAAGHLPLPRGLLHTTRGGPLHTGWRGRDKAGGRGAQRSGSALRAKRGLERRDGGTIPRRPQRGRGPSRLKAERCARGASRTTETARGAHPAGESAPPSVPSATSGTHFAGCPRAASRPSSRRAGPHEGHG